MHLKKVIFKYNQFKNINTKNEVKIMLNKKYNNKKSNLESLFAGAKRTFENLDKENSAQGAAEYILLFGGVIVIALAGLLIYRSYFASSTSGLNATKDINSIRDNMTSLQI